MSSGITLTQKNLCALCAFASFALINKLVTGSIPGLHFVSSRLYDLIPIHDNKNNSPQINADKHGY